MDPTDGNTSDQTVQSQETESELATGSYLNVVNRNGQVQLGSGTTSTVINNQTYNSQHHYHHHHNVLPPCPVSQRLAGVQLQDHREEDTTDISGESRTHRETDNNASYHVPRPCQACMQYHLRGHQSLTEPASQQSESRHSGQYPVQLLQQTEQQTEQREHVNIRDTERNRNGTSAAQGRRPDEMNPVHSVTDSEGRPLEPGDAVRFVRGVDTIYGIYVGGQRVVWCERTGGLLVHDGELQLDEPFRKAIVINRGQRRVFPSMERVLRATARVGAVFTEGDGWDFPYWMYTGTGLKQAVRKGFVLRR